MGRRGERALRTGGGFYCFFLDSFTLAAKGQPDGTVFNKIDTLVNGGYDTATFHKIHPSSCSRSRKSGAEREGQSSSGATSRTRYQPWKGTCIM